MRTLTQALLAGMTLLFPLPAAAGGISFLLALTVSELTATNQGDSAAFHPAVFRMVPDGRWERLAMAAPPAYLPPGALLRVACPAMSPVTQRMPFEPVMVRFFDQAGVGFGQILFSQNPPPAKELLTARYAGRELLIEAPVSSSSIRTSWVLWAGEEGIAPIRLPVRFEHHPLPARRIDWRQAGARVVRIDVGAGQPSAFLLHETEKGYASQTVPGGHLQGWEQRSAWLDAGALFYRTALLALGAAAGAVMLHLLLVLRRRGRA